MAGRKRPTKTSSRPGGQAAQPPRRAIERQDRLVPPQGPDQLPVAVSTAPARLWPYIVAVLLLPLIVLWRQDDALYTPPWYADPWFYLGYFRNLIEFKRDLFYGFYYGSRLSWILPGSLVHSLFPPIIANAVLHLSVQSTAALSLFFVLRLTAGVRSAFLATMVFSVQPWLWVAIGWDYPDGAGIAYCLLAMALLTRAAVQPVRKWSLLWAGGALAGMAYTHVFLGTLTPLLLLYYIGLVWGRHRESVIRSMLTLCYWAGAGFGIVTVVFCGINYLLDGHFWFYAPSLVQARNLAKNFRYIKPIWDNNQLAPWLWPGVAGSMTAILLLPSRVRRALVGPNAATLMLSIQLLLAVAYMAYLQSRGTTVLGHYPYVSYLLPFVFLVMGVSFWPAAESMSFPNYAMTCCVAAVIFGALWYNPHGFLAPAAPATQRATTFLSACALATALLLRQRTAGTWLAVCGFAAFTAVALAHTANLSGLDLHGNRRQYQRIMHARERIETVRQGRTVRFWFDQREPNFHEYSGLNALYLEEFSQLGTGFPLGCDVAVDPDTLIVVVSQKKHAAELAGSALADCWRPFGMRPVMKAVEVAQGSDPPYIMAMLLAEADVPSNSLDLLEEVALERVQLGDREASLRREPEGLVVTTRREFGAFAGRVTLGLDANPKPRLAVHVRARVLAGKVGFGVLGSDNKTFLVERSLRPLAEMTEVVLPLPMPPVTGDLIISNTAPGDFTSKAIIERIEIRKMP